MCCPCECCIKSSRNSTGSFRSVVGEPIIDRLRFRTALRRFSRVSRYETASIAVAVGVNPTGRASSRSQKQRPRLGAPIESLPTRFFRRTRTLPLRRSSFGFRSETVNPLLVTGRDRVRKSFRLVGVTIDSGSITDEPVGWTPTTKRPIGSVRLSFERAAGFASRRYVRRNERNPVVATTTEIFSRDTPRIYIISQYVYKYFLCEKKIEILVEKYHLY